MKIKTIKKYLGQGTILTLLHFFSYNSIRTLKGLISGNFEFFIGRIYYFHIGNLVGWWPVVLINIFSISILCYTTDRLIRELFKKENLKNKNTQIYLFKVGLFFLKYTLVGVFAYFLDKIGLYISREYFYTELIMLGITIVFHYFISWIISLIKKKRSVL